MMEWLTTPMSVTPLAIFIGAFIGVAIANIFIVLIGGK